MEDTKFCHCCNQTKEMFDNSIEYDNEFYLVGGYYSIFDGAEFIFTRYYESKEELITVYPWVAKSDEFCNDCYLDMVLKKDIRWCGESNMNEIPYPIYTGCCDKLVDENHPDHMELLEICKETNFPYTHIYYVRKG